MSFAQTAAASDAAQIRQAAEISRISGKPFAPIRTFAHVEADFEAGKITREAADAELSEMRAARAWLEA